MRAIRFAAAGALAALALASPARAAELPVELLSASSGTARPREAAVEVRTEPGATCGIAVISRSGPSKAAGLGSRVADDGGRVAWRWSLGPRPAPGRWPVVVTCQKGPHLGRLETALPVR